MEADALLIGKKPTRASPAPGPSASEGESIRRQVHEMPKYVVSTTLKDPEWNNTNVLDSGDATAQVTKLKHEFDGEIQVPAAPLVHELFDSDLVDGST